jgi:hypothetical protein
MNTFNEDFIHFVGEDEIELSGDFYNSWLSDFYEDEANYE